MLFASQPLSDPWDLLSQSSSTFLLLLQKGSSARPLHSDVWHHCEHFMECRPADKVMTGKWPGVRSWWVSGVAIPPSKLASSQSLHLDWLVLTQGFCFFSKIIFASHPLKSEFSIYIRVNNYTIIHWLHKASCKLTLTGKLWSKKLLIKLYRDLAV